MKISPSCTRKSGLFSSFSLPSYYLVILYYYSEEAERCYNDLMSQWSEEDDMCQQILDKVFETIDAVLLEKLEANADLEQHILEQRKSLVETLYSLFSDLQTKPTVWKAIGADVLRLISSDRSSAPTADSLTPKIGSRY